MRVSGGWRRASARHRCVSILPQTPLPSRLPRDTEHAGISTQGLHPSVSAGHVLTATGCGRAVSLQANPCRPEDTGLPSAGSHYLTSQHALAALGEPRCSSAVWGQSSVL